MIKKAFDEFFVEILNEFKDNALVVSMIEDAEELSKYGENRIALENFLENILSNEITISDKAISLAEEAFSDFPNDYDVELIKEFQN